MPTTRASSANHLVAEREAAQDAVDVPWDRVARMAEFRAGDAEEASLRQVAELRAAVVGEIAECPERKRGPAADRRNVRCCPPHTHEPRGGGTLIQTLKADVLEGRYVDGNWPVPSTRPPCRWNQVRTACRWSRRICTRRAF